MSAATLANTISLLDEEVLETINGAIVRLGHKAVGHQMDEVLQARGDSVVVETDVRLLWDAIRAASVAITRSLRL